MKPKDFDKIVEEVFNQCKKTLCNKKGYGTTEDRLSNFKRAGALQKKTSVSALAGMLAKHTIALNDYISDLEEKGLSTSSEEWNEKIIDSINYLLLLQGLLKDEGIIS